MTAREIARYLDSVLGPEAFAAADPSRNGLQADNDGSDIGRVAFAVDASLETIERAADAGAGMLVVHHGLFWRESERLVGSHYRRVRALISRNVALYASHLPLDAHPEVGNNAGLARRLGLVDVVPFGRWRGVTIGVRGRFPEPVGLDEAVARMFPDGKEPLGVLPFGPKMIHTVGVVSGGGADEVADAIDAGLDLFVTGEPSHERYHLALESGISVIAAGHYQTETVGPRLLSERVGRDTGLDVVFVDVPTGL